MFVFQVPKETPKEQPKVAATVVMIPRGRTVHLTNVHVHTPRIWEKVSPKEYQLRCIAALVLEIVNGSRTPAAGSVAAAIVQHRVPEQIDRLQHHRIAAVMRRLSITLDSCRSREELLQ